MIKTIMDNPWKSAFGLLLVTGCIVDVVDAVTGNTRGPAYTIEFGGEKKKEVFFQKEKDNKEEVTMAAKKIQISETYVDSAPFVPVILGYFALQKHNSTLWWTSASALIGAIAFQYAWDVLTSMEKERKLKAEIEKDRQTYGW